VALPYSTAKLSFRLPPTVDGNTATAAIKKTLRRKATLHTPWSSSMPKTVSRVERTGPGLLARDSPWHDASEVGFGKPPAYMGEGGTIPFMGMLGEKFPETQFVITGVLGPQSNAHGPNEFLTSRPARP
jgi:acetylornithine deacetylase/succinyl-diaminopimelate desuccinylase-like protein